MVFTSNENFDAMVRKGTASYLIGLIHEISPTKVVGQKDGKPINLLSFILSNDTGRKLLCDVWDPILIEKFEKGAHVNQAIRIEYATIQKADRYFKYYDRRWDLVPARLSLCSGSSLMVHWY